MARPDQHHATHAAALETHREHDRERNNECLAVVQFSHPNACLHHLNHLFPLLVVVI